MAWINEHLDAVVTFVVASALNLVVLAVGYGRTCKRLEDVERCQKQCAELFVRKDVLQPQLDAIKLALSEVQRDIKTLLGLPHGQ